MKLSELNFKKLAIYFQWHGDNIESISDAYALINHNLKKLRIIGSLQLIEHYNGMRIINGFTYAHKIIYNQPNIYKKHGLSEYEQAMRAIVEFQKIHHSLKLVEDESEFIALEKDFLFITPVILKNGLTELESQITSILRRWIEKISEITQDDDLVLIEKTEVKKTDFR